MTPRKDALHLWSITIPYDGVTQVLSQTSSQVPWDGDTQEYLHLWHVHCHRESALHLWSCTEPCVSVTQGHHPYRFLYPSKNSITRRRSIPFHYCRIMINQRHDTDQFIMIWGYTILPPRNHKLTGSLMTHIMHRASIHIEASYTIRS